MQRFWVKVEKTDSCWNWTAGSRGNGYGAFRYQGKVIDARRFVWFLIYGKFAEKLVCHSCDNKRCVNPAHLFEGSYSDNLKDAIVKGINKVYENNPYTKKGCISINRKLTFDIAEKIRKEYFTIKITQRELAKKHKVGVAAINLLLNRKQYIK